MSTKLPCPRCAERLHDESASGSSCPICGGSPPPLDLNLNRLKMTSRLGAGSFGEVWAALDADTGVHYAVKLSWRLNDDSQASSLMRELNASRLLNHPNIAKVHQIGRSGDRLFIISDLIEGMTLGKWWRQQIPSPPEAVRLCGRLARILQHAHDLKIVHRDLKPSNIIVSDLGDPYLLDFGLAREGANEQSGAIERYQAVRVALRNSRSKDTRNHVRVMGTPAYMSPEQASGQAHLVDGRSDVYSLGIILYELLVGQRPRSTPRNHLLRAFFKPRFRPPRRFNAAIPEDIEAICLKALEKKPQDRYQSAGVMADDCARAASGQTLMAH